MAIPTLLGFALFMWRASTPTLWGDELATWDTVHGSWATLTEAMHYRDTVIFPYYAFMYAWVHVFGDSELSLRMPSILAMTAAVAVTALLAARLFGRRAGLCGGLVFAAIPTISRDAQEVRVYAFVIAFAVLSTYFFVRASEPAKLGNTHRYWWVGYGFAIAALSAAHFVALVLLLAHGLLLALRLIPTKTGRPLLLSLTAAGVTARQAQTPKSHWISFIAWLAAAGLGSVPALCLAWRGYGQRSTISWLKPPSWTDLDAFPSAMFGSSVIAGVTMGLAIVACSFLNEKTFLLVSSTAIPIAALATASTFGNVVVWHPRYLLFVLPFCAILAGKTVSSLRWPAVIAMLAIAVVFVGAIHIKIRQPHAHSGYDARAMPAVFSTYAKNSDAVMFAGGDLWHIRNAYDYYSGSTKPKDVLINANLLQGRDRADVDNALASSDRVWLVRIGYSNDAAQGLEDNKAAVLRNEFRLSNTIRQGRISFFLFERASGARQ